MSSQVVACAAPLTKDTGLELKLRDLSGLLNKKWMLLGIFLMLISYLGYMVFINLKDIYNVYLKYKQNIREKQQVRTSETNEQRMNPQFDNEIYDNPSKVEVPPDYDKDVGKAIRTNINNMKTEYKEYNKLLRESKPKVKDYIDEKILSAEHDDY
jgi:hypothetical protein